MHTDRRTDITKVTRAFDDFANAPKIERKMQTEITKRKFIHSALSLPRT